MGKSTDSGYHNDLAYIHDAGFGNFAEQAGCWLLEHFRAHGIARGPVVDLGCGSGIMAAALSRAGFEVVGYDLSPSMIALARRRVPAGRFHVQSFLTAEFPPCVAVTAIGEIFNYLFDARNSSPVLGKLFARVYRALEPGGVFVFDGAEPGRGGKTGGTSGFTQGDDWACLYTAREDRAKNLLTRDITSFRKVGGSWRRDHEVHRLRLFNRAQLLADLRSVGFRVRTSTGYGPLRFPAGYVGFVARKP